MRVLSAILVAAIVAFGLYLRSVAPLADPPRWLTSSYSALVDGPWYTAEAAARCGSPADAGAEDPAGLVPPWYRKPLNTRVCEAVYAAFGASPRTRALPAAIAGALLAAACYVLLARAAGRGTALLAALFVAVDATLVGWGRTSGPYPLVALLEALSIGLAAAARRGGARGVALGAAALATIAVAAWGTKAIAISAAAPALLVLSRAEAAPGRRERRIIAAVALIALAAIAAFALRDPLAEALARLRSYAGDLSYAAAVRRVADFPVASRAARLGPVVVLLAIVAPWLLLRPPSGQAGAPSDAHRETPALRLANRAALLHVAVGVLVLGPLVAPDVPYLVAFWPSALVLAALTLAALARGGRAPAAHPAVAAFAIAALVAFVGIDFLVGRASRVAATWPAAAPLLDWFGDPYYLSQMRFTRTLACAALFGAAAASIVARRAPRASPSPPRPGLAALLAIAHVAWQIVLVGGLHDRPSFSLEAARDDLRAAIPYGARVGEHFAHALADGREVRARYLMTGDDDDLLAAARAAGVTHLVVASDRWTGLVRPRATTESAEVASLYVGAVRVRIVRLAGVPARTPFERARERLDAGAPEAARALLTEAIDLHPDAHLLRVHRALAAALAGDVAAARADLDDALALEPRSFAARVVLVLVCLREGAGADPTVALLAAHSALHEAREALALAPDRRVEDFAARLESAIDADDAAAIAQLAGTPAALLAGDALR